jgi:hypothetical protein
MTAGRMYRLRAAVRQIIGGRLLLPGDDFPSLVTEHEARGLLRNHYAVEVTDAPKKRLYRRRDMTAE